MCDLLCLNRVFHIHTFHLKSTLTPVSRVPPQSPQQLPQLLLLLLLLLYFTIYCLLSTESFLTVASHRHLKPSYSDDPYAYVTPDYIATGAGADADAGTGTCGADDTQTSGTGGGVTKDGSQSQSESQAESQVLRPALYDLLSRQYQHVHSLWAYVIDVIVLSED